MPGSSHILMTAEETMRQKATTFGAVLTFALALLALGACSDNDGGDDPIEVCGPGMTMTQDGECIRSRGTGGSGSGTTGGSGTATGGQTSGGETGGTSGSGSGSGGETSGGETGGTAGSGGETGGTSGSGSGTGGDEDCGGCPEGQFCLEGQCRRGSECNPGEILGCKDEHTLRVCPEGGVGFTEDMCPTDKPNCVDSKCTKMVCTPKERFCKGNTNFLMECSADGMKETQIKECRGGCRNGQCVSACSGNAKTYIGCDFMAIDLDNYIRKCSGFGDCGRGSCDRQRGVCYSIGPNGQRYYSDATNQPFAVTVSNTRKQGKIEVTVTDGKGNQVKQLDVPGDSLKVITLPKQNINNSELSDKSFRIKANGPITVHQFNPQNQSGVFSNDASLLLPANALGKEYIITGWPSLRDPGPRAPNKTNRAYMTIGALMSGETKVTVTPKGNIVSGNGVSAISKGQTKTFTLQQGQVLNLTAKQQAGNDLTGSLIKADKEIAVFSGHECATVPTDVAACDHLEQQMFPVEVWGKEYVLSKFAPRGTEDDIYRVVASQDNTTLSTNPPLGGVDGETLDKGEFHEFKLRGNIVLNSDKPVAVGQFMVGSQYPGVTKRCKTRSSKIGDPAFLLNVPTDQFRNDYFVLTPDGYAEDYVNIIAKPNATIEVDGNPVSVQGKSVGNNASWKVYQVPVDKGVHQITASKSKFGLYAYGYECDVSYAYPGGLDLSTSATRRNP